MSQSITIALPTSSFLPNLGGAEVGLHNIASRLVALGHNAVVIVPFSHYRRLQAIGWRLPYEVIPFPPRFWAIFEKFPRVGFYLSKRFFAFLRWKYDFDFWHVTMGYPTGVAFVHFARSQPDVRYLIRCAGEDIQKDVRTGYGARLDAKVDTLIKCWLPLADNLVAITDSVAEEYRKLGVDESHIHFVPNGVDLNRFNRPSEDRSLVRARIGVSADEILFLAVGRHHRKKNYSALVEAAALLKKRGSRSFKVMLVGAGVMTLREQVEQLGVADQLILHEQVGPAAHDDMPPELPGDALVSLYRAADIFVFPSLIETFGIVLVEAMAAGLPIITTDAPGCRDIIRKGRDGIMVPPHDNDALADAMFQVMMDPAQCEVLAEKARRRAQDFSWDLVVERYLAIYCASAATTD